MTSSNEILFYDITRNVDDPAIRDFSYNTLRTRLALNIKGLAYKTVWVDIADVESESIKVDAPPNGERAGKPLYTSPFIVDPSSGRAVSDSPKIATYLDVQYPNTPVLSPSGSEAEARTTARVEKVRGALQPVLLPRLLATSTPRSLAHFRAQIGEERFAQITAVSPEAVPGCLNAALEALAELEGELGAGPFLGGEKPCWADTFLAGLLWALKNGFGEGDELWKAIVDARGGRWGAYMQEFEKKGWLKVV
ncbi:hypothetical protein K488DRAFT_85051 [Vararia minispora EC-137]|uniref:Uncharacterized protein n=1 Tax=Vararia minispora EC-137 TaxID=1314806 RepID=A0ACB8QNN8_9AGAM|nr:hypothetical protein K488DRAFT_85051 [Vararia minispora EC-137]